MSLRILLPFVAIAFVLMPACTPRSPRTGWAAVVEVTPAFLAQANAVDPSLAVGGRGQLALTWVTRDSSGAADVWLSVSNDSGARFSAPLRVNSTPGEVTSYPESRPVAAFGPSGQIVVVWAARRSSGAYADDLKARGSSDGGVTFGPAAFLNSDHLDPRSTYHGFATLGFLADGRALAAWIDGRASVGMDEPEAGEIYAAVSVDGGGSWGRDTRVAADVCACCRIELKTEPAATGGDRVALAYRGMRGNLRDPRLAVLRASDLSVQLDTLVSADRWFLRGCPSMGPSLTWNRGGGGHYLWYTGESAPESTAAPKATAPGVYVLPWRAQSGAAGMRRALSDSLTDATRPMLAGLDATTLLGVVAHPREDSTRSVLAVRALELDGELGPWLFLGAGVRSGTLAAGPSGAYAAWVERQGETARLRLARIARRAR